MPPAAVIRDRKIGITPAGDRGDAIGGRVQSRPYQAKMSGGATLGRAEDDFAALAHGGGIQQRRRIRRSLTRRAHGL